MEFSDSIISYYRGEKTEAITLTYSGIIVSILIYSLLVRYPSELTRGLLPTVSIYIAIAIFAGAFNALTNHRRLKELPIEYGKNEIAFVNAELLRFEGNNGVNRWWFLLNITWTLCVLFGLIVYFLKDSYYAKGMALGIVFLGFSGLLIDSFAKERAERYTKQLYAEKAK